MPLPHIAAVQPLNAPSSHLNHGHAASDRRTGVKPTLQGVLESVSHFDFPAFANQLEFHQSNGDNRKRRILEQFQISADFQPFATDLKQTLLNLQKGQFSGSHSDAYRILMDRLGLNDPAHGIRNFGSTLLDLYAMFGLQIKQIKALLDFAKSSQHALPPDALKNCRPIMKDLEQSLDVCGPGILSNTDRVLKEMGNLLFPPPLLEQVNALRVEMAQQQLGFRLAEIFKDSGMVAGNQIHMVNTWMNHLADSFAWPSLAFEDMYASPHYYSQVNRQRRDSLVAELRQICAYPNVLKQHSTSLLQTVQERMSQLDETARNDWSAVKMIIDEFQNEHQLDLPTDSIIQFTDHGFSVNTNPSLLVAHLREKLINQSPEVRQAPLNSFFPDPKCFVVDKSTKTSLFNWSGICWKERPFPDTVERTPIELDDLTNLKLPTELGQSATEFLAECLRNHDDFALSLRSIQGDKRLEHLVSLLLLCGDHPDTQPFRKAALRSADEELTKDLATSIRALNVPGIEPAVVEMAFTALLKRHNESSLTERIVTHMRKTQSASYTRTFCQVLLKHLDPCSLQEIHLSHIAARGHLELVKCLIENEMHHDAASEISTRLFLLANIGPVIQSPQVFDYLINNISIEKINSSPLHKSLMELMIANKHPATSAHAIQRLVDLGAKDIFDSHQNNALQIAIAHENIPAIETLLKYPDRFEVNHENESGCKPMELLLTSKITAPVKLEVLKLLIKAGARDKGTPDSFNSIAFCCGTGDVTAVSLLLNSPDRFPLNSHALIELVNGYRRQGTRSMPEIISRVEILKLIKRHNPQFYEDAGGLDPIVHSALRKGHQSLAVGFLRSSAELDVRNSKGYARLHLATLRNDPAMIAVLAKAGADMNLRTNGHAGKTALHLAFRMNNPELILALIEGGANPGIKDAKGRIPQDYAEQLRKRR